MLAHVAARLDALLGRGLRARTTQVFQTWREAYRGTLTRAQQRQIVLATVDPSDVAHLLVAQIEGTLCPSRTRTAVLSRQYANTRRRTPSPPRGG
jgi:hypothetical protein